jgi:hypothetical protein
MYRHFMVEDSLADFSPQVEYTVLTKDDNQWGKPVMILDDEVRFLNAPWLLEGYVYESIFHSIVSRVQSHFLIHAGVVSRNGQGVIIAADSGHGKTTLVLELVRREFMFLSDEMAAIGRSDQRVYPFPRCLRIRPGTLERAGFPDAAIGAPLWLDKLMLDIDEIKANSLGGKATIKHIVILRDPAEPDERPLPGAERVLEILVDHLDDAFVSAASQVEDVTDVHTGQNHGYPSLMLSTTHRAAVLPRIETLCRKWQILVLDVIKRREEQPSFGSPARLEEIPNSQGVMELVRRFQGGHKSALLQKDFERPTQLFVELAALVNQANCHHLFVGSLERMADLVCGLVGAA